MRELRGLLQYATHAEDGFLVKRAANDLQSKRQAILVQASRQRKARKPSKAGGNGEYVVQVHGDGVVLVFADSESRRRRCGGQDDIAFLIGPGEVAGDESTNALRLF